MALSMSQKLINVEKKRAGLFRSCSVLFFNMNSRYFPVLFDDPLLYAAAPELAHQAGWSAVGRAVISNRCLH